MNPVWFGVNELIKWANDCWEMGYLFKNVSYDAIIAWRKKNINVHMLLTFCIRITNYQDFIFTYLAANCIRARAHLPDALPHMFKNPAIIKSGRKLPPDENCRRCSINISSYNILQIHIVLLLFVCLMAFNVTFSNISAISWRSILLVEETRVLGENHRSAVSHWQTVSYNVVSSTSRNERDSHSPRILYAIWWYLKYRVHFLITRKYMSQHI